ncbi:hypothetical protein [Microbacterium sp.]|uniref:hypothetical protein n=1 Tax=Microbacterium sp. TaxID=51671 RepID=UPI0039E2447A
MNPILTAFRESIPRGFTRVPAIQAQDWADLVNGYTNSFIGADEAEEAMGVAPLPQIEHARKVLTRLANLANDKEN